VDDDTSLAILLLLANLAGLALASAIFVWLMRMYRFERELHRRHRRGY